VWGLGFGVWGSWFELYDSESRFGLGVHGFD